MSAAKRNPQSLAEWRQRVQYIRTSQWRAKALHAMWLAMSKLSGDQRDDPAAVLTAVDDAYPFGPRENYPYKAWLAARLILIKAMQGTPTSAEEFGVCEVAADLIELGRMDEARELLEKEAPGRHDRPCSACGVRKGVPCREPILDTEHQERAMRLFNTRFTERDIPHRVRIEPLPPPPKETP